jgi:hypothetical protein
MLIVMEIVDFVTLNTFDPAARQSVSRGKA